MKSLYERYENLLGRPYVEGSVDCYGLLRDYYKQNYDLELTNYARPGDFAFSDLDLIMNYFQEEEFKIVEVSLHNLEIGDGLLMQINGAPLANHVAVYVGNQMILHHLYGGVSKEDPFNQRWKGRTLSVVRHPEVTRINQSQLEQINMMDIIPAHDLPNQG